MKLVDFQYIQDGVRKLAAVKETFEHMQEAYKEAIAALTDGIIAQGAGVTVLYGCINSGSGLDYNISAGAVYYSGEIYEVPAFVGTATGVNVPVLSLSTSYRTGDPALYKKADETTENINTHSIRKLLWSLAASGSGIVDFSAIVTIKARVASLLSGDFAPLASPAFTGTPTAPTAATSTDNTQIATTAFVKAVVAALVDSSPATLDTLNELAAALGDDANFATTVTNALANKADITDLADYALAGGMSLGPSDFNGTQYSIDSGSSLSPVGWPLTTGEKFQVVTTASHMVAVQLDGTGAGDVYYREYSGGWGAWTKVSISGIKLKILDIGDWNMDANDVVTVAHGLDSTKIAFVQAKIISDAGGTLPFGNNLYSTTNPPGANHWETWHQVSYIDWNTTHIVLRRMDGSIFDSTSYDATSFNRGRIYIWYEP